MIVGKITTLQKRAWNVCKKRNLLKDENRVLFERSLKQFLHTTSWRETHAYDES